MEIQPSTESSPLLNGRDSPPIEVPSQNPSDDKAEADKQEKEQVKKLLSEARSTKEVLMEFRGAIESGTYPGAKMMALAKGLAFLEAVINQNQAHISNLQGRN